MAKFSLSLEKRIEVARKYFSGKYTQEELAEEYGIPLATIGRYINHVVKNPDLPYTQEELNKVKSKNYKDGSGLPRRLQEKEIDLIVQEYLNGEHTQEELAEKHGIPKGTMFRYIKKTIRNSNSKSIQERFNKIKSQNYRKGKPKKLNEKEIKISIVKKYFSGKYPQKKLAEEYGASTQIIRRCINDIVNNPDLPYTQEEFNKIKLGYRYKKSEKLEKKREIVKKYFNGKHTQEELAEEYGLCNATIWGYIKEAVNNPDLHYTQEELNKIRSKNYKDGSGLPRKLQGKEIEIAQKYFSGRFTQEELAEEYEASRKTIKKCLKKAINNPDLPYTQEELNKIKSQNYRKPKKLKRKENNGLKS